jgi:hypothetical protein
MDSALPAAAVSAAETTAVESAAKSAAKAGVMEPRTETGVEVRIHETSVVETAEPRGIETGTRSDSDVNPRTKPTAPTAPTAPTPVSVRRFWSSEPHANQRRRDH